MEELTGGGRRIVARRKKNNNLQSLKRHVIDAYQDTNSPAFQNLQRRCVQYWPTNFQNCTSLIAS